MMASNQKLCQRQRLLTAAMVKYIAYQEKLSNTMEKAVKDPEYIEHSVILDRAFQVVSPDVEHEPGLHQMKRLRAETMHGALVSYAAAKYGIPFWILRNAQLKYN